MEWTYTRIDSVDNNHTLVYPIRSEVCTLDCQIVVSIYTCKLSAMEIQLIISITNQYLAIARKD